MCGETIQQADLAVGHALIVPGIDQAVGPEHQQVRPLLPGHLAPLNGSYRSEPEGGSRSFQPLRRSGGRDSEGMRMSCAGVREPPGERIEYTVKDSEVHFGL